MIDSQVSNRSQIVALPFAGILPCWCGGLLFSAPTILTQFDKQARNPLDEARQQNKECQPQHAPSVLWYYPGIFQSWKWLKMNPTSSNWAWKANVHSNLMGSLIRYTESRKGRSWQLVMEFNLFVHGWNWCHRLSDANRMQYDSNTPASTERCASDMKMYVATIYCTARTGVE